MTMYNKAIAAVLGGLVTLAGAFGLPTEWATPEMIAAIGTLITTVFVYAAPANK